MAELIIGAAAAGGFLMLSGYARGHAISVGWWGWLLTLLAFFYGVFVLLVVVEFLREGTPKGAVVMGTLMGFLAVVWAVLLARFVFRKTAEVAPSPVEGGSHV